MSDPQCRFFHSPDQELMIEARGYCQELLFVEKSLEKLFSIPTLPWYLSHYDWPNISIIQSKKMGVLSPKGLITLSEVKSECLSPMPPSGRDAWYPLNTAPAEPQKFWDPHPDITWHTQKAGLPGAVSSVSRAGRGRLFVCVLSKKWLLQA